MRSSGKIIAQIESLGTDALGFHPSNFRRTFSPTHCHRLETVCDLRVKTKLHGTSDLAKRPIKGSAARRSDLPTGKDLVQPHSANLKTDRVASANDHGFHTDFRRDLQYSRLEYLELGQVKLTFNDV